MDLPRAKSIYWVALVAVALVLAGGWVQTYPWSSSSEFHTLLEMQATLLAWIVGGMSLVLYHSRRDVFFLLMGSGFIGAGLLDAYHTVATSIWTENMAASGPHTVTAWSWLASRMVLALLFVYAAYLQLNKSAAKALSAKRVYAVVFILAVGCLLMFVMAPLGNGYIPDSHFSRPAEFIPGVLFLLAALMLYRSGKWQESSLHYCILIAVVLSVVAQLEYMAVSRELYDAPFDVAHGLKLLSYVSILSGLMMDMFTTYSKVRQEIEERVRQSEQQKWGQAVREQEHTYKSIVDSIPLHIYFKDANRRYVLCNKSLAEFIGVDRDELLGKHSSEVEKGKFISFYQDDEEEVISTGKSQRHERLNYFNYENRWYDSQHIPMVGNHGNVSGVIGILRDVTEKRERENELLIKSAAISESINAIALCGLEGNITYVNQSMVNLMGCSNESRLLDRNISELMSNEGNEYEIIQHQIFKQRRWQGELVLMQDTGRSFYVQLSAALLNDVKGRPCGILVSLIDISEQKRAMDALVRSEETFSKAQEIAHIGSWDWDMESNELSWSDEIYRIFGLQPKEFEATYEAFLACVHPEDQKQVIDAVSAAIADKEIAYSVEHRVVWRDGTERVVHEQGKVYRNSSDKPIRMIGTVLDITERKQVEEELERHRADLQGLVEDRTRELEAAHVELIKSERLATLGKLTAMVSHELRNPLGAMKPSLYLIAKKVSGDENLKKALERLDRNISRCDHIIDELLDFTRFSVLNAQELDLESWLKELAMEQAVPAGITVREDFRLGGEAVSFDPGRLARAVINLMENAIHAMQEKQGTEHTLTLSTSKVDNRWEISVSDTGGGIPKDILGKIHEPLFSTKGFGVGLGIPAVQQIMEQHGGGMMIKSEEGRGTKVTIWLPVVIAKEAGEAA